MTKRTKLTVKESHSWLKWQTDNTDTLVDHCDTLVDHCDTLVDHCDTGLSKLLKSGSNQLVSSLPLVKKPSLITEFNNRLFFLKIHQNSSIFLKFHQKGVEKVQKVVKVLPGAVPRGTTWGRTVPHYPITRGTHHHGTTGPVVPSWPHHGVNGVQLVHQAPFVTNRSGYCDVH